MIRANLQDFKCKFPKIKGGNYMKVLCPYQSLRPQQKNVENNLQFCAVTLQNRFHLFVLLFTEVEDTSLLRSLLFIEQKAENSVSN